MTVALSDVPSEGMEGEERTGLPWNPNLLGIRPV